MGFFRIGKRIFFPRNAIFFPFFPDFSSERLSSFVSGIRSHSGNEPRLPPSSSGFRLIFRSSPEDDPEAVRVLRKRKERRRLMVVRRGKVTFLPRSRTMTLARSPILLMLAGWVKKRLCSVSRFEKRRSCLYPFVGLGRNSLVELPTVLVGRKDGIGQRDKSRVDILRREGRGLPVPEVVNQLVLFH